MKLRRLAAGAGFALGLAGATLAARVRRPDDVAPPLGREQSTYRWRGLDVAYTEAGDPDDPDLLLLHGVNAAASSHEFDRVFDRLAADHRVVAPDLPGFGRSDRPPLLYSADLYESFVADAVRDLADRPTVVASSLTGAYAAATARSVDVDRLVLVSPTTDTVPWRTAWLRDLLRSPGVGELLFDVVVSRASIRRNLADHGFADPDEITDERVDYDWRTGHLPGARYAPASFLSGFLDSDLDLAAALRDRDDVTIVWGSEAELTPPEEGRELAAATGAAFVPVEGAALLPHAERPDAFLAALERVADEAR